MSNMKRVLEWLTGPDAFFEVDNTPNHRLISVLEGRMQFISDRDLAHMMSMCEAESVNRMAQQYSYMDDACATCSCEHSSNALEQ